MRIPPRFIPALVCLFLVTSPPAGSSGRPEGMALASRLYAQAKYREAAEEYARSLSAAKRPAAGEVISTALYNRGNALYRLGNFAVARESYVEAAVKTRNLDVEGRATYNIGNCYFREAEEKVGSGNLQEAAASLESSIAAYRRALELAPARREAATNLEVARILLKGVRDEIAKYGDLQDIQRQIVEKLKVLIATELRLIERSGDPETSTADLRDAQEAMRLETGKLLGLFDTFLGRLARLQGRSQEANPYTEARRYVVASESHQARAVATLSTGDRAGAARPQRDSREALEKALEILTPPEREDRSEQGGDQSGTEDDRSAPPENELSRGGNDNPQPSRGSEPSDRGAAGSQAAGAQGNVGAMERAEDILQEEGENRRSRDAAASVELPVDKDW